MVRNVNKFSKNPKRKAVVNKLGSKKLKKEFNSEDDEESLDLNEEVKHVEEGSSDSDEQLSVTKESDDSEGNFFLVAYILNWYISYWFCIFQFSNVNNILLTL
jgi:hypothetical protein